MFLNFLVSVLEKFFISIVPRILKKYDDLFEKDLQNSYIKKKTVETGWFSTFKSSILKKITENTWFAFFFVFTLVTISTFIQCTVRYFIWGLEFNEFIWILIRTYSISLISFFVFKLKNYFFDPKIIEANRYRVIKIKDLVKEQHGIDSRLWDFVANFFLVYFLFGLIIVTSLNIPLLSLLFLISIVVYNELLEKKDSEFESAFSKTKIPKNLLHPIPTRFSQHISRFKSMFRRGFKSSARSMDGDGVAELINQMVEVLPETVQNKNTRFGIVRNALIITAIGLGTATGAVYFIDTASTHLGVVPPTKVLYHTIAHKAYTTSPEVSEMIRELRLRGCDMRTFIRPGTNRFDDEAVMNAYDDFTVQKQVYLERYRSSIESDKSESPIVLRRPKVQGPYPVQPPPQLVASHDPSEPKEISLDFPH